MAERNAHIVAPRDVKPCFQESCDMFDLRSVNGLLFSQPDMLFNKQLPGLSYQIIKQVGGLAGGLG